MDNGFRTVSISFNLGPGIYVIGGQQLTGVDSVMVGSPSGNINPWGDVRAGAETTDIVVCYAYSNFRFNDRGIFGPNSTVETPEPGSPALLALGAAALTVLRRFQR